MNKKAALVAPLALSLSMAALADPGQEGNVDGQATVSHSVKPAHPAVEPGLAPQWVTFDAPYRSRDAFQVRIEQRVVVRIAPRSSVPRQSLTADLQPAERSSPPQLIEKRMDDCLKVSNIAAVQTTRDDRLLLYLRDRRLVSAKLEKSCRARDFYSGFYVERNKDGKLCRKRDKLLSRSGANCEIDRLRQLVSEKSE
ncbi:hypothetical protein [Altererythrobacter sp. MF3-039]|uniref:hypothetical protein n=1 Tax=Altererythrobacter sp. MF3-039 TaxID=3252901 RepID=UPI00390CC476